MALFWNLVARPMAAAKLPRPRTEVKSLTLGLLRRRTTGRQKFPEQLHGINAQRLGDRDKFHDIDPPFTALVFGDEGLRSAELLGQGMLANAGLLSRCDKKFDQAGIFRGSQGFLHGRRGWDWAAGNLIPRLDYPKKG